MSQSHISRRSVAKGAAWSIPAVTIGTAAPALAASPPPVTTQLINVPWSALYDGTKNTVGDSNSYIAYVLYPTSTPPGTATFTSATPAIETGNANNSAAFPSDYTDCSGANSVEGVTTTVLVENIGGDTQYSATPKTYNDVPGNDPSGNAWPYIITQQPDRGTNYEVTSYGAFQPQPGSLNNQYNMVMSTKADGRPQWTWTITMIAATCSAGDGAGAIEYQIFFPPHYAPAGTISNPTYRITTVLPWGTTVFYR